MYLKFYGFTKKPFNLIPDPEFMHFSEKHKLAYSLLEYGVYEQTGLTVITGEIGSGKTTLLRYLLKKMNHQEIVVGLIDNTHDSLGDLPGWIATAFNIDYQGQDKAKLYREIQHYIIKQYSAGKRVLLIVDEAQNMSDATLEELRLLMNINSGSDLLLQIILVGQPELLTTLLKPNLTQLAQRVSVEYHLEALSLTETNAYISHRVKTANGGGEIFDQLAIEQIYKYSGGIPRLINVLCDNALVYGYALDRELIGGDIILDVVKTRKIGALNRNSKNTEIV
ncbi:MAG: AAA family ATPase [Pseudomonadota bacterium]